MEGRLQEIRNAIASWFCRVLSCGHIEGCRHLVVACVDTAGRAQAEAAFGKGLPDGELVAPGIVDEIGLKDGVASLHEVRVRRLEFAAIDHELQSEVVATDPGVEIRAEAVGLDEIPIHLPERCGPDFAQSVDLGE